MYKITITQRQGKNSEYKTTERIRIHGNFLELPFGDKTPVPKTPFSPP